MRITSLTFLNIWRRKPLTKAAPLKWCLHGSTSGMKTRKKRKPKFVWMEVTKDKLRLPLKIADSAAEMAEMCGVTTDTVVTSAWRTRKEGMNGRFIRIPLEE